MFRKTIPGLACLLILASHFAHSQTVNYDDVAVIVNDSSPVSLAIGNYFAAARGIPPSRILHVATTTQETVDSLQFEDMRAQIEAAIVTGNLLDTLNYLVTTKGMPLRVSRGGTCDSLNPNGANIAGCTCVESELPLILGAHSSGVLQYGHATNPYNNAGQHFDRDSFGIFLVSRLDGNSQNEVLDLIDRSGPGRQYSRQNAKMVIDAGYMNPGDASFWNGIYGQIQTNMQGTGVPVQQDQDSSTYLSPQQNVAAYYGVHYQPSLATMGHSWEPGGFGYLQYHFTPTFDPSANPNGEYRLGDMIGEGATVVAGYVYMAYYSPSPRVYDLFSRYFDTLASPHYNAAEAFYMSFFGLSSQSILIGDPKTSVMPDIPMALARPSEHDWKVYPNPSQGRFVLEMDMEAGQATLEVHNQWGQLVLRRELDHDGGLLRTGIEMENVAAGMYFLRMEKNGEFFTRRIIIEK